MIVVSDTSVLSCLAEIGELDLLRRLYGEVTVTDTILGECRHVKAPAALQEWFSHPPHWLMVAADPLPALEETMVLDAGEASAITLAWRHRNSSLLLIDERRGRRISAALGLNMTGTAGILADAAASGWFDFEDGFQRLAMTQFRLSGAVVESLRRKINGQGGEIA